MTGLGGFTSSSTDGSIPDTVIRRIKKLLSLANDGRGNEAEMQSAAAMAQSIISAYGVELAQLESQSPEGAPQGGKREKSAHDRSAMYAYQRDLMEGIAATHFCKYFTTEVQKESFRKLRTVKQHVLLGRSINVQACTMLYDYLVDTMDRLLPWQGMEKRGKNALLWLDGCSSRLVERLAAKRREMEAEGERTRKENEARAKHPGAAPRTNALVLSDIYSSEEDFNNDFIMNYEPGTTARNRALFRARQAQQTAEREEKYNALIAAGTNAEHARYLAAGWTMTQIVAMETRYAESSKPTRPETEAQRTKRERAERARDNREWERMHKARARYHSEAYQMGAQVGSSIGLDSQVSQEHKKEIK